MTERHQPFPALPEYTDAQRIERARAAYERLKTRHTCRSFTDATTILADGILPAPLIYGSLTSLHPPTTVCQHSLYGRGLGMAFRASKSG